ncbi:MAG: formylglycine-generating enzyme family protein [Acidobacteriota bacterium]
MIVPRENSPEVKKYRSCPPPYRWWRRFIAELGQTGGYLFAVLLLPLSLFLFFAYQQLERVVRPLPSAQLVGTFYGVQLSSGNYLLPEMVHIPAGSFEMGSDLGEIDELPIHQVKLGAFKLGRFEVTNAQWKSYCDAIGQNYPPNPKLGKDYFLEKPNHPVLNISWQDAQDYCQWLSQITGQQYRLPTEAEWEYAAQDSTLSRFADNRTKTSPHTAVVGSYQPNQFGLFDMLGNVWEWCEDWYNPNFYRGSALDNPQGADKGKYRVLRGGSWGDPRILCRVSNRIYCDPMGKYRFYGLRIAASIQPQVSQNQLSR